MNTSSRQVTPADRERIIGVYLSLLNKLPGHERPSLQAGEDFEALPFKDGRPGYLVSRNLARLVGRVAKAANVSTVLVTEVLFSWKTFRRQLKGLEGL